VWSAGVSAVLLAALALVGLAVSNVRIRAEAKQKELALEEARANHERAEERRKEAHASFKLALKAVDDYGLKVARDPRLQAHDLRELRRGLLQSAIEFYRQFVAQRGEDPTLQVELARACRRRGALEMEVGNLDQAIACCQQSADILTALVQSTPDDLIAWQGLTEGRIQLGTYYRGTTRLPQAEAEYKKALEVPDSLLRRHPDAPGIRHLLAACNTNLGNVYRDTSRAHLAEEAYRTALALQQRLVQDHPGVTLYENDLAASHNNLGVLYHARRDLDQAAAEHQKVVAIRLRVTKVNPHEVEHQQSLASSYTNLGQVHQEAKNWAQAQNSYQEAVKILERAVKEHASVTAAQRALAGTYDQLGLLYGELRQVVPAERELAKALAILEPLASRHPNATEITLSLAFCYLHSGMVTRDQKEQPGLAIASFLRAIERCEAVLKQEPRQYGARFCLRGACWERARCLNQLGRHAEALADWRRALELDGGKDLELRAGYACGQAAAGEHAAALAEINAVDQTKELPAGVCFNLACACAGCAAIVRPDPAAEDCATRAVALLARARAGGYFQTRDGIEQLEKRSEFDSLRGREDFKQLLNELRSSK